MNTLSLARGQSALDSLAERAPLIENAQHWPPMRPLVSTGTNQPYPVAALPDELRLAVIEAQSFTQAPVALVACSALASLSLVCQGLVDVQRAPGLRGPVGLFTLVIAESGERKSSSDGLFRPAIDQYERDQVTHSKPALLAHEKAMAAWEARIAGVKDRIRKLAKDGDPVDAAEDELAELFRERPVPPRVARLLYCDVTSEALAHSLATEWPSGGILSAEAGTVFGGHAMSVESVMRSMALLNSLWDGARIVVDRRNSESFVVDGARLTIGLQVQPAALLAFLNKHGTLARGIGFLARFLFACPASTQGTRAFRAPPISWPGLERLAVHMRQLLDVPVTLDGGRLVPIVLHFSAVAQEVWIKTHDIVESELTATGELASIRDVASKSADNVARLACIFHVLRHGPAGEIGPEDVVSAGKLVAWHLQEAKRFLQGADPSNAHANAEKLERFLVAKCGSSGNLSVSFRYVQQFAPHSLREATVLNQAIAELARNGRARLRGDAGQRRIEINPALMSEGQ